MVSDAAHADEASLPCVPHRRQERPGHMEGCNEVDRELLLEFRGIRLFQRPQQKRAGVAHHDIGGAVLGHDAHAEAVYLRRVGQVAGYVVEAPVRSGRQAAGHSNHLRALARQQLGRGGSDPAGGAGHHRHQAGQPSHSE
jgi:hypothetical protein